MSRRNVPDVLVCKAVAEWHGANPTGLFPPQLLALWTGEPEKVCLAAMERSLQRGLIECGVSLRTAWLTDMGELLLSARERSAHTERP